MAATGPTCGSPPVAVAPLRLVHGRLGDPRCTGGEGATRSVGVNQGQATRLHLAAYLIRATRCSLVACEEDTMAHVEPVAHMMNVPEHLCIPHLLQAQARRIPEALAVLAPGRVPLTYGRLHRHVHDTVQRLHAMGLGRHDHVALVLPNGPEMAVALLAVTTSATCAPLNPACSADEFDFYLTNLQAQAVILQAGMD